MILKKISKVLLILLILMCANFSFTTEISLKSEALTQSITTEGPKASISSPLQGDTRRILPLSILVYTEYVDNSTGGEWENILSAINSTYGTDYYYKNLTDYTNLATELPNHDILLIPEQEKAPNNATMKTIGTAWTSTLTNFITRGGIVILMDYYSSVSNEYGITSHIYNSSGLLDIKGFGRSNGDTVNLVNTSDALARGVDSTWTAPNGALTFNTSEKTSVVDNGTHSQVIHKIMGRGHIVLLGFDLFNLAEPNSIEILGNAIRLHRHVVFDDSHGQSYEITSEYSDFVDALVTEGFAVSSMNTFDQNLISACEVLVVPYASAFYSNSEKAIITSFVSQGGGIFLQGENGAAGEEINDIAQEFGYNLSSVYLLDSNENMGSVDYPVYSGAENINNHSLTLDVISTSFVRPVGFEQMPNDAVSIIVTDSDSSSTWFNTSAAEGVSLCSTSIFGSGRIVVIGDCAPFHNNYYSDNENEEFSVNTVRWLSAAGLKEQIVLFDESHTPWVSVNSNLVGFVKDLTSNGYTVKWMSTFYSSLINQADILVICDGSVAYTSGQIAEIKSFVENGGGLFIIGGWGNFGDEVDPIGNEFGLDRNDTGYLDDSDDSSGSSTSYIIHNESNINPHPITQGISRVELYRLSGFDTIGSGTALVTTDTDDTCTWSDGGTANGIPVIAATEHQLGRVVFCASYVSLRSDNDGNADGTMNYYEQDNSLLFQNIIQWVSNKDPVVHLVNPNGGENIKETTTISWTASDPNWHGLMVDLSYSSDGGSSWTPIATDIENTSINWDTSSLPDNNLSMIRAVASNFMMGSAEDTSDTVFTVDNTPPVISNILPNPLTPSSSSKVNISATITDISGLQTVTLNFAINNGSSQSVAMTQGSGNTFSVLINGFNETGDLEFYITAVDNVDLVSISSTNDLKLTPPLDLTGLFIIGGVVGVVAVGGVIIIRKRRK